MGNAINVIVIGTEPPCPRCDLLSILVANVAASAAKISVKHCAFDSPLAQQVGEQSGCKVGTAKHVADDAGIPMDWDAVYELIERSKSSLVPDARPADAWTPELDEMLRPCQVAAESTGYLMTPVLMVNGKVVHQGSVPSQEQVTDWLRSS